MSIEFRRPTTDDVPNAWHVEKKIDESGIYVRITPESGVRTNEIVHATQVRKMAMGILRSLGFEQRMDEVELILGEFATNDVEHGGGIDEVGIVYRPETLEVKTVNQLPPGALGWQKRARTAD